MSKKVGDIGESELIDIIACPNCSKDLILLPTGYPLYDIQCTACNFRAQLKTSNSKPKSVVRGAGWEIINKVLRAGYLTPPLLVYFKWKTENDIECHEVRFYPFVPKKNLKKYILSPTARRANYKMFNYVGLNSLPYFVLSRLDAKKRKVATVDTIRIEMSESKWIPIKNSKK